MNRGDLVTVALPGDLGKPRPAVVIQSNHLPGVPTVLVCPITSVLRDAEVFRLSLRPNPSNGLRIESQAMIDKVSPVRRERCGPVIGALGADEMADLDRRLAFVLGLAG
jgi:mRNA interferase MazF